MKWTDKGSGDFTPAPAGTHIARCIKVIDIGTQRSEYQGQVSHRRQCIVGWELPTELMEEGDLAGQPFIVTKFYTASLGEKANLRKDLEAWRGRAFTESELAGFESRNILGVPCLLSVIHNEKGKARVNGVMALPKGTKVPKQMNASVYFSLEEFDQAAFDALSDGIKKLIQQSPEYQDLTRANGAAPPTEDADWEAGDPPAGVDEEIPF